jgi:uncharacterized protein (TIGR00369 family)
MVSAEARVADSFKRQAVMRTLNAELKRVAPGEVEIGMPYDPALTQQHGFLHAGIVATVMDSACGYAAFSMMPEDAGVLSIEFKINLLAPAKGSYFRFVGQVLKSGRTITVCEGRAYAVDDDGEKLVSSMTCTVMTIQGREGISG